MLQVNVGLKCLTLLDVTWQIKVFLKFTRKNNKMLNKINVIGNELI